MQMRASVLIGAVVVGLFIAATPAVAVSDDLDPTFSGDGKAFVAPRDSWTASLALDAGKVYASGTVTVDGKDRLFVARLNDDGTSDTAFSGDGVRYVRAPKGRFASTGLTVDPSGRPVMVTVSDKEIVVYRSTTLGDLDHTFSGDGRRLLPGAGSLLSFNPDVVIDGQGRMVVAARVRVKEGMDVRVWRLLPQGALDDSWSGDGVKTVDEGNDDWMDGLAVDQRDRVLLGSDLGGRSPARVYRFRGNGSLDNAFGSGGVVHFRLTATKKNTFPLGIAVNASGDITVPVGTVPGNLYGAARFTENGELDTTYGNGGLIDLTCKHCAPSSGDVVSGQVAILVDTYVKGTDIRLTRISGSGDTIEHLRFDPFPGRGTGAFDIEIDGSRTLIAGGGRSRAYVARGT